MNQLAGLIEEAKTRMFGARGGPPTIHPALPPNIPIESDPPYTPRQPLSEISNKFTEVLSDPRNAFIGSRTLRKRK